MINTVAEPEPQIFHEASRTITTSLPLRRKNRVSNSHPCFSKLKVISDKLFNNPQFRDAIDANLMNILQNIQELESAAYGEGELGIHEPSSSAACNINSVGPT